ncbi:thiamine-repressible mitochondrial transport protein THI74 isoform X1 [Vigna umbellata]|uniref:thiamine-repressible mitochondrial transport protein THI74 isoform X1 n=1 Tax=Vigna umbellata TaxID=87088 RepID=UPI001F5EDB02|nr:thiamine-repressible mitochondrial transport protein THI74 isoform X1 [Vigna umbellata]
MGSKVENSKTWKWILGLIYIFAVATIWIAASFVVQSVVDAGVSPFLVTYICNSLFVVLIPIVEIGRYLEDSYGGLWFWRSDESNSHTEGRVRHSEQVILLKDNDAGNEASESLVLEEVDVVSEERNNGSELVPTEIVTRVLVDDQVNVIEKVDHQLDEKGRWSRCRVAKVSLLICPFWFLAQLTFNLSLKYTTVTSNTILSSASSLFTFLVSLAFLGERFTWLKLFSVLLCMGGTIFVSLGDSKSGLRTIASNPLLGDIFALLSAGLYAVYITLIRMKLPDSDGKSGEASTAQFLGYLGLFNVLIFLPVALILNITKMESFSSLTWKQLSLIIGKGLLDNVLSDYLWAKAVLLTSTTVATAGLTIQVPLAAIVDTLSGHAPGFMDYLGAISVMIGFTGINIPSDTFSKSRETAVELENESLNIRTEELPSPKSQD